MKAASFLAVLVVAKVLVLAGRPLTFDGWALAAFTWQDAATALAVGVVDVLCRRHRMLWAGYAVAAAYVAINVPIARVLPSPLTWPMIHAAGGPLADSIATYLTSGSIARIAVVAAVALATPFVLARFPRAPAVAMVVAAIVTAIGPLAARHVDTAGLDRNALTALLPRALPVVGASTAARDWRESPWQRPRGSFSDDRGATLELARGSAAGRNVVMIVLESTAAQYLKPYGAASDPMPNLTRLSANALLFANTYAAYPESIKGLWSTLCSKFPAFGMSAEEQARRPCVPLASRLASHGYRTALFHSGRFAYLGMDAVVARQGFDTLEDAGAIGGNIHSSFGVDESATVQRTLRWVDALPARQPFFVAYLPIAGHHPYATPAPGPYPVRGESDQYLNALAYADASIAGLLDGLRARGLYDRTMFVIFGDHGEAFGQHAGNAGHTFFLYDENVRVPLLIVIPGVTNGALRSSAVASLVDVAPTILDALGVPDDRAADGVSLLERRDRMALFLTDYSLGWLGLRDGCLKYLYEIDAQRSKLFDVCADPGEQHDVSARDLDRVARYRDQIEQWSAATRSGQRP